MDFQKRLEEIIERINFLETKRIKLGRFLRKINEDFNIGPNEEIVEPQIINKIEDEFPEKVSVLGVDGGIIKHSYHGLDLVLMRSVGVNFIYEYGKLVDVTYYPSSNPLPIPKMLSEPFSDVELNFYYNFERQIMEIQTTIEATEKLKPDFVLLDGSVIPTYVTKPDNPELKQYYNNLLEKYKELFEIIKKHKLRIAGIVEDSRGMKFCDIIKRRIMSKMGTHLSLELQKILDKTRDTNILFYILKKQERTCIFNYSSNPEVHPILKEFEKLSKNFFTFYIRTADFDRPVRVDFISFENPIVVANDISSVLLRTSGHAGYGIPSVLIEADQRAKLNEKDMEMFYSDLVSKIGNLSTLFKMRREMRPF
ncbi:MAG: DNA double-strand break repair nuclease NurA [Candidatus Aenigmatarchaeota archaeon]